MWMLGGITLSGRYISSRIYENRTIGLQEPTQLKLTQLE